MKQELVRVITESLNGIRIQFIQNNTVFENLSISEWVGLEHKIILLQEIATQLITEDSELLSDIENTKNIITKNTNL